MDVYFSAAPDAALHLVYEYCPFDLDMVTWTHTQSHSHTDRQTCRYMTD